MTLTATSHLFVAGEPCGGRGPGRKHLCTQSDVRSPLVFPLSNALYLSSLPYNSALQPNRRAWKIPWLLERTSYRDFQHEMFGTAQGWEQEHRQAEAPQTTHLAASRYPPAPNPNPASGLQMVPEKEHAGFQSHFDSRISLENHFLK